MTFTQLRTFVAVAQLGSVRGAAEQLTVTESAVSAAVASLQRELEVALVRRVGRGLRLTPAGSSYADYARRILGLLDEARLAALGDSDLASGELRIAAVTSAGEHLLPLLLAGFRAQHPRLGLALEVGTRAGVWSLLRDHAVDVVIAGRPPGGKDIVTRAVRPNELVVVAAPGIADDTDVRDLPWLLREVGSGTRDSTEALLEALQAEPVRLTLGSNGAVIRGAAAGLGVTLASRDAVRQELSDRSLTVVPVPGTPLRRPYHVVTHRAATATAEAFVEHLLAEGDGTTASLGFHSPERRPRRRPPRRIPS